MRFVAVVRADERVGILDNGAKPPQFAHFLDAAGQHHPPLDRARRAADRLNDGTDTKTGYEFERA